MGNADRPKINCGDCGADLTPTMTKPMCPGCGSGNRHLLLAEDCHARESVWVKIRLAHATGRPDIELRSGDDLTRTTGEWVTLDRRIDRKNDWYYERILDQAGTVVREIAEPLSQHRGHGAARRAVNDSERASQD